MKYTTTHSKHKTRTTYHNTINGIAITKQLYTVHCTLRTAYCVLHVVH
jgi:hypothetical protein